MDTIEDAIYYLKNSSKHLPNDIWDGTDEIIEMLKRGEKLKKIWEKFELKYGQYMIPVEGDRTLIKKLMIDIEINNQYFPYSREYIPKEENENRRIG